MSATSAHAYGEWLRALREAAGLTQQELADMAFMSRTHIAHIEAGRRIPTAQDARSLDRALEARGALIHFLPKRDLAVADYFGAIPELEQQAREIREFAAAFVPGILQTPAYARAVLGSVYPPVSAEELDRRIATRLGRAAVLDNPVSPAVWALMDESVLRRPVGGHAVMADQIRHLVALTETGRVRTHVITYEVGAYQLMQGMLSLMWFDDQPPLGYSEGVSIGEVHDSPHVVTHLQGTYDLALSDALPLEPSLALMRAIMKEHEDHDRAQHP